jgi:hypothetical protein
MVGRRVIFTIDMKEAIKGRHSVRSFTDEKIEGDVKAALEEEISRCNVEGGLNMQLVTDEPGAFDSFMAHYGKFSNVRNYIALVGPKDADLDEKVGYYGEHVVLKAQQLGLNTCWVALTFSKKKCKSVISAGEKQVCIIAVGYGTTEGVPHKSKDPKSVVLSMEDLPDWFKNGVVAALLAPTAMNQQKFALELKGDKVFARNKGGPYSGVDIGIVKCHFELGSGRDKSIWG